MTLITEYFQVCVYVQIKNVKAKTWNENYIEFAVLKKANFHEVVITFQSFLSYSGPYIISFILLTLRKTDDVLLP